MNGSPVHLGSFSSRKKDFPVRVSRTSRCAGAIAERGYNSYPNMDGWMSLSNRDYLDFANDATFQVKHS